MSDGPRVMQAMAGAAVGGAEAFFMRLAIALQEAGQDQRVLLRRHESRAVPSRSHWSWAILLALSYPVAMGATPDNLEPLRRPLRHQSVQSAQSEQSP